jgi:pilus assembly protein CpaE
LEELTPVLMRYFPGAAVREVRGYPEGPELHQEFRDGAPDVCFVDVLSNRERALALIPLILGFDRDISVVALLAGDDAELILRCLRAGAKEFLRQPFAADQVSDSLAKLARVGPRDDPQTRGKVYCVLPAKGACGATTVACHLAHQWKSVASRRVLLADLDPITGVVSFLLKMKSDYSFVDAINRADTLDTDLWKAMVVSSRNLDVLLAPELLVQGINELRDATPIVNFARKMYDMVVLDCGSPYGEWSLSQARAADEIILVTTNELPSLHGAQRALAYLEANQIGRWKFRIVVNRYDKQVGLGKEAVASALHADIAQTIPSDYETIQTALIDGKPVPSGSSLGKSFATLADRLSGREQEPVKRTAPFGALLSLFSRTSS